MFRKKPASSPVAFKGGGEENEKKLFVGRAKNTLHALPGNESQPVIYNCTYCTVRNEGPAEEAGKKQPL